ncbi:MAG: DUF4783 domain-containing protein [Bacteroidota bacterium]
MKLKIEHIGIMLTLTILALAYGPSYSQSDVINNVKNALKSGSSKELAKFLNQNVDVTIGDDFQTFSKTQAEYALRDFFKENVPDSFTIIHQGASKGNLHFFIGKYTSNSNAFRVFLRIKNISGRYLIHEISFTKE